MQRDLSKHMCHELEQDLPRTLSAFWSNQLERIKQRVEIQLERTSIRSRCKWPFRLDSGDANNN
jgi:hypothetical protein